jgi:uncharacterized cupin superfamily protein
VASTEPVIVHSFVTDAELDRAPIDPSWIIEGTPRARARSLSLGDHGTIRAFLWDCSAGRFEWHYDHDEIIQILEGEAEITSQNGVRTPLRPGDMVSFPAAQIVVWHVPRYVRKVALFTVRISTLRKVARRVPFARRVVSIIRTVAPRAGATEAGVESREPQP